MMKFPNDSFRCAKCGGSQFNIDYTEAQELLEISFVRPERMRIGCQRCGWMVYSHPKDYKGE